MSPLYDAVDALRTLPLAEAAAFVLAANATMFAVALATGVLLVRRYAGHRILPMPPPPAADRREALLAAACVVLNGLVAVAGIVLWRESLIDLRPYGDYGVLTVLLDAGVLFLAMDVLMYAFHRVAHLPLLYPLAHITHHRYDNPRPLTLFVLSPIEVLGFGALWLMVLMLYTASAEGILIYLSFNLAVGLIAHLGVEPAPPAWVRLPLLRYVSTSTFHAEHHNDREHNYGFYLSIWDRLFGTLSQDYARDFGRASGGAPVPPVRV